MSKAIGLFLSILFWGVLLVSWLPPNVHAQGENNRWYFGEGAGLDFNGAAPTALSDGNIRGRVSTVVSDADGNLLFYTDGKRIWDRRHQLMPDGAGLLAAQGWTQSVAVIPVIDAPGQYYLFTVSSLDAGGILRYSIVDLNLNGGFGAIIPERKNIELDSGFYPVLLTQEMECGVWLLTHQVSIFNVSVFNLYPIDFDGIGFPQITSHGVINEGKQGLKKLLMAISPDGTRLAISGMYDFIPPGATEAVTEDFLILFDFFADNGKVLTHRDLDAASLNEGFGLAFSPNSRRLYTTEVLEDGRRALFQYDLASNVEETMAASRTLIYSAEADCPDCLAQIAGAPDDRLYVARPGESSLGVIRQPDATGSDCDYQKHGLPLGDVHSTEGLPNRFTPAFQVNEPLSLRDTMLCRGQTLDLRASPGFDTYTWQDGATGPAYRIDSAGQYRLTATFDGCPIRDTLDVSGYTSIDGLLGPDTSLCDGASLQIDGTTAEGSVYTWNDGQSGPSRRITTDGAYWLDIEDENGCVIRDELRVEFRAPVQVGLGSDTMLCREQSLLLQPSIPEAGQLRWQDGSTAPSLTVNRPGIYSVQVTDAGGCTATDTIEVTYSDLRPIRLGPAISPCEGEEIILEIRAPGATDLQWSTGERSASIIIDTSGTYSVEVSDGLCRFRAEQRVNFRDCCTLYAPNAFSPNDDGANDHYRLFFGCNLSDYHLRLYNRLGQLVFETRDIQTGWDGLINGRKAPSGVYLYSVAFTFEKNNRILEETRYGSLNLLR